MELKTKKITPTKRVCFRLKEAREQHQISLSYMAKKLRMSEDHVLALESCRFDELPFAPIYQKNLIRSYLKILGMNPKHFIDQFVFEEMRPREKKQTNTGNTHGLRWLTVASDLPLIIRLATAVLIVGGVIGYLAIQVKHIVEPPSLAIYAPDDGMITNDPLIRVQGKTEREVQVQINGKNIMNSENGIFDEEITLSEGVNTLIFSAKRKHGKVTTETKHIIYKKGNQLSVSDYKRTDL